MEVVGFFFLLMLVAIGGAWAMFEYMTRHQPERERTLRAELDALQAAQRLSIASWHARQAMAEEAERHADDAD